MQFSPRRTRGRAGPGDPRATTPHPAAAGDEQAHETSAQAERTHSAIAVSDDGERWVLLNASSDIGQQLRATPALRPRADGQRPIRAVVLMDAHIDHVAGLLALREGPPLTVVATPAVFEDLTTGLPLLNVLQGYCGVRWQALPVAGECGRSDFVVPGVPGLAFAAFAVPGAAPPYSLHDGLEQPGDHIAVQVEDLRSGLRLFYAPGPVPRTGPVQACMRGADRLLVDGSAWPEAAATARSARAC
ncbi:MBL fold metallo-hydrolase [Piscinibacter sakaiensis]|uniref:MBL fold metallo-hydrolase n=1 Tax=Piscinibacter sakaiensis TaxID=1547922 RepID=UPI00372969A8